MMLLVSEERDPRDRPTGNLDREVLIWPLEGEPRAATARWVRENAVALEWWAEFPERATRARLLRSLNLVEEDLTWAATEADAIADT